MPPVMDCGTGKWGDIALLTFLYNTGARNSDAVPSGCTTTIGRRHEL